jgi:C4-dicarboxylate transporter DctQ subunit
MRFLFITLPHWAMGCLMLAGVAICSSNVVARYFFGRAIFWAEEVMVFLVIWGVFLGVAAAAYERAHLNMDLFSESFSPFWTRILNAAMVAALLACCGFMMVQSFQVVKLLMSSGSVSVSAGVPRWIPHLALPVGFGLMALAVLSRLGLYLKGK